MIWIIGGTSETKEFLKLLPDHLEKIVTVTTEDGRQSLIAYDVRVIVGRMNQEQMEAFIARFRINKIVDLSHPYATEVTYNAKIVSHKLSVPFFRFTRLKETIHDGKIFTSLEQCADFLRTVEGTIFFTTGIKSIPLFESIKVQNRHVYRILPSLNSFQQIEDLNINLRDIIAVQGPVSLELNIAMIKEFSANFVVMKNAGRSGGMIEKIEACRKTGVQPLIIDRPTEVGFQTMEELLKSMLES